MPLGLSHFASIAASIVRPAASVVRVRPPSLKFALLLFPELSVAIKTLEEEEEEGEACQTVRPSVRQTAAALNKHAQRTFTPPAPLLSRSGLRPTQERKW